MKKIQQFSIQNQNLAKQIHENLEIDNGLEEAIKQKQDKINMLRQEYQKLIEQKNVMQDQQIKQKNERKNECLSQQNINQLLVKYTRLKFGQINENYIIAYYLNNDQQTIPICIEREKNRNKNTNEKIYKTNEEITQELRQRVEEIQTSYI
ncbi:hypothetical protein ABPG74_005835 [Tetrahymena malaccensis]